MTLPAEIGSAQTLGWDFTEDTQMTVDEWESALNEVATLDRHLQFYAGDLLWWASQQDDEFHDWNLRANKILAHVGGQTISLYLDVAAKFDDRSRRRPELSWSHHREVSNLVPGPVCDQVLDEAIENSWSVQEAKERAAYLRAKASNAVNAADGDEDEESFEEQRQRKADMFRSFHTATKLEWRGVAGRFVPEDVWQNALKKVPNPKVKAIDVPAEKVESGGEEE